MSKFLNSTSGLALTVTKGSWQREPELEWLIDGKVVCVGQTFTLTSPDQIGKPITFRWSNSPLTNPSPPPDREP